MADDETNLIAPHGGSLTNLQVDDDRASELEGESAGLTRLVLTPRQLCDIEQLITGGFSPLAGFMNQADYEGVRDDMRLSDGTLWPMPIVLDVGVEFGSGLSTGSRIALMHPEGVLLAVLTVDSVWEPDRDEEASKVFGTNNDEHPGVNALVNSSGSVYIGGTLEAVRASQHRQAWLAQPPDVSTDSRPSLLMPDGLTPHAPCASDYAFGTPPPLTNPETRIPASTRQAFGATPNMCDAGKLLLLQACRLYTPTHLNSPAR